MALLNHAKKELNAKIVYYGPGLSGKTTNLEWIHKKMEPEKRGKLISLETKTDRTLFFDFLPVQIGEIAGYRMRFNVYTVPGQIFYNETRKMVLKGVDGVVFVADCQREMASENVESLKNLAENLASIHKDVSKIPLVLQYNKMDLANTLTVEEMNRLLNEAGHPFFEAIAVQGEGVLTTLARITRMVAEHLRKNLFQEKQASDPVPLTTPPPVDRPTTPTASTPTAGHRPGAPAFLHPRSPGETTPPARGKESVPEPEDRDAHRHPAPPARVNPAPAPVAASPLLNDVAGSKVVERGGGRVTPLRREAPTPSQSSPAQPPAGYNAALRDARHVPSLGNEHPAPGGTAVRAAGMHGSANPARTSAGGGKEPPSYVDPSVVRFQQQPAVSAPAPSRGEPFTVHLEGPGDPQGDELQVPIRVRHEATGEAFRFCLRIQIDRCDPKP